MASAGHEADADDDVDDAELKKDREHEWLTRLCGSGARLWPHVSLELWYLAAAAGLAVVAAILGSACTVPRCYVLGAQVSGWVMWAAFSCAISVPGRVIDKLIFAGFSALGEVLAGGFLVSYASSRRAPFRAHTHPTHTPHRHIGDQLTLLHRRCL